MEKEKLSSDIYKEDLELLDEIKGKLSSGRIDALHVVFNRFRGIPDETIDETCACEGCTWYDGIDHTKNTPRCLNLSPPIDKKFLSITAGNICRKAQEDLIQLHKILGKQTSWKKINSSRNIDVATVMGKKYVVLEEQFKQDTEFYKSELDHLSALFTDTKTALETDNAYLRECLKKFGDTL